MREFRIWLRLKFQRLDGSGRIAGFGAWVGPREPRTRPSPLDHPLYPIDAKHIQVSSHPWTLAVTLILLLALVVAILIPVCTIHGCPPHGEHRSPPMAPVYVK